MPYIEAAFNNGMLNVSPPWSIAAIVAMGRPAKTPAQKKGKFGTPTTKYFLLAQNNHGGLNSRGYYVPLEPAPARGLDRC